MHNATMVIKRKVAKSCVNDRGVGPREKLDWDVVDPAGFCHETRHYALGFRKSEARFFA